MRSANHKSWHQRISVAFMNKYCSSPCHIMSRKSFYSGGHNSRSMVKSCRGKQQLSNTADSLSRGSLIYNILLRCYQHRLTVTMGSLIPVRGIPVSFQAHTPFLLNSAIEIRNQVKKKISSTTQSFSYHVYYKVYRSIVT